MRATLIALFLLTTIMVTGAAHAKIICKTKYLEDKWYVHINKGPSCEMVVSRNGKIMRGFCQIRGKNGYERVGYLSGRVGATKACDVHGYLVLTSRDRKRKFSVVGRVGSNYYTIFGSIYSKTQSNKFRATIFEP